VIAEPLTCRRGNSVRPDDDLLRQVLVAFLAVCAPILTVLYWVSPDQKSWGLVFSAQIAVTVLFALGVAACSLTRIDVEPEGITTRDHFGRRRFIPVLHMAGVVSLELIRPNRVEPDPQLFLVGHDGYPLLRMHGRRWSTDAMRAVADAVPVPTDVGNEPHTLAELNRIRPRLLSWVERRLVCHALLD
jgi:hypothetical protein